MCGWSIFDYSLLVPIQIGLLVILEFKSMGLRFGLKNILPTLVTQPDTASDNSALAMCRLNRSEKPEHRIRCARHTRFFLR